MARAYTYTSKQPDPADIQVGHRVRALRLDKGTSQTALGVMVGVTFQQIQKYEKGTNRISSGRLQKIAEALNVPMSSFYDSVPADADADDVNGNSLFAMLQKPGAMRLLKAFNKIESRETSLAIVKHVEAIAAVP